jgi:hypothetical protein
MLHFHHGYITCLYVPVYLVGDVCTQIVAILLFYVSILACCSALCIFEKHILALVDLIHALPIRGRKVPNSCFQGEFASRKEKLGEMHLFRGELAFMHLGALFRLNFFSCSFADGVEPFCLTLRSRQFWSILSRSCRVVALALGD